LIHFMLSSYWGFTSFGTEYRKNINVMHL
jgi:hypothetical protein